MVVVVVAITVTVAVHQVLHPGLVTAPEGVPVRAPISSVNVWMPILFAVVHVGWTMVLCIPPGALDAIMEALACYLVAVFARRL